MFLFSATLSVVIIRKICLSFLLNIIIVAVDHIEAWNVRSYMMSGLNSRCSVIANNELLVTILR